LQRFEKLTLGANGAFRPLISNAIKLAAMVVWAAERFSYLPIKHKKSKTI
jgi:hypothetical protein